MQLRSFLGLSTGVLLAAVSMTVACGDDEGGPGARDGDGGSVASSGGTDAGEGGTDSGTGGASDGDGGSDSGSGGDGAGGDGAGGEGAGGDDGTGDGGAGGAGGSGGDGAGGDGGTGGSGGDGGTGNGGTGGTGGNGNGGTGNGGNGGNGGAANDDMPTTEGDVLFTEFVSKGDGTTDYVELYNTQDVAVNLRGCFIIGEDGADRNEITSDIVIPAKGYVVLAEEDRTFGGESRDGELPFGIAGGGEILELECAGGSMDLIDTGNVSTSDRVAWQKDPTKLEDSSIPLTDAWCETPVVDANEITVTTDGGTADVWGTPGVANASCVSGTQLSAGDVALVLFRAGAVETFQFVLLVNVEAETQVRFTDNPWLADDTLGTNEGTITVSFTKAVPAGSVLTIDAENLTASGFPTAAQDAVTVAEAGSFVLSNSDDQLIAYQGATDSPTALFAFSSAVPGFIATGDPSSSSSYLPAGLALDSTAVEFDATNAIYTGPKSGESAYSGYLQYLGDSSTGQGGAWKSTDTATTFIGSFTTN